MNKSELIHKMVELKPNLTIKDATAAVEALTTAIGDALKNGDDVQLVGFGTFKVNRTKERQGRNPASGAPLTIPAKNKPAFSAGKGLKDKIA